MEEVLKNDEEKFTEAAAASSAESANEMTGGIDNSKLKTAPVLAFLFGAFGIHNFMLKQYGRGLAHIAIQFICVVFLDLAIMGLFACDNIHSELCVNNNFLNSLSPILLISCGVLWIANCIWAMAEGAQILQSKE